MWRSNKTALLLLLGIAPAYADGMANAPPRTDTSKFATRSDLASIQSAIMSAIPLPGSSGSSIRYMREDAASQWRSTIVTLDATGAASGTWTTPLKSAQPIPGPVSPINADSSVILICNFVSPPTQTSYSVKCMSWGAPAPAGTKVGVTALEASP